MKYILTLLLILTQCTFATPQPKKIVTIADIHFNPFSGCDQLPHPCPILTELTTTPFQSWDHIFQKYTQNMQTKYYQDTNYLLLSSTLKQLQQLTQQQDPAYILLLGDYLAHKFPDQFKKYSTNPSPIAYQAFVKKTLAYLTYKINLTAPNTSLFPVVGNNDSYNGNYYVEPNGQFFSDTNDIFATFIKNSNNRTEFQNQYFNAGYYAITQNDQRLIVLNTVLFAALYPTTTKQIAANEEVIWLEQQLKAARQNHQSVLIALHIPLGIDVFRYTKFPFSFLSYFQHPLFFQPTYNEKILSLFQNNADIIAGILAAHTHHDNFQLMTTAKPNQFITTIITPSISPIYGNNPGLKIITLNDKTSELLNMDTYVYPLEKAADAEWQKEYNFNDVYQPKCNSCTIANGIVNLKTDKLLINSYEKYFGKSLTPSSKRSTMNYWCAIYNMNWNSYKECLSITKKEAI